MLLVAHDEGLFLSRDSPRRPDHRPQEQSEEVTFDFDDKPKSPVAAVGAICRASATLMGEEDEPEDGTVDHDGRRTPRSPSRA